MCVLCYELAPDDHWSDAVAPDHEGAGSAMRARGRRTRILSTVLGAYGLTVSDPGTGRHCTVADRKGSAEVVAGLPAVWDAANRLAPRPVDALDALLLDTLDGGAAR